MTTHIYGKVSNISWKVGNFVKLWWVPGVRLSRSGRIQFTNKNWKSKLQTYSYNFVTEAVTKRGDDNDHTITSLPMISVCLLQWLSYSSVSPPGGQIQKEGKILFLNFSLKRTVNMEIVIDLSVGFSNCWHYDLDDGDDNVGNCDFQNKSRKLDPIWRGIGNWASIANSFKICKEERGSFNKNNNFIKHCKFQYSLQIGAIHWFEPFWQDEEC